MTTTYKIPLNATEGTEGKPEVPKCDHKFRLGQLILVEWHNSTTKKNEWREAMFLHYHDADDRPWRAEIEIDGKRITGIAPECIKSRESAPPSGQPHKRQESRHTPFDPITDDWKQRPDAYAKWAVESFNKLHGEWLQVSHERNDLLRQRDALVEACKAALDYATDVCPSAALPYESKLRAAIAAAEKGGAE